MTTTVEQPLHAPLAGLRIIELSSFVAAPLAGMTLGQLGAEVIRIDPVGGGKDRNRWPIAASGSSLYWAELNKGKRSITVDLRSEAGRTLVGDLIEASGERGGIVLTNDRPRDGFTYDELRTRRADLIHLRLKGHRDGSTAVDYTVNAATGFPMVTGPSEHAAPINHVVPVWDVAAGLYIAVGLLAAERHRSLTGAGQSLEIALADVALATAGNLGYLAEAELGADSRSRIGNQVYGDFGTDFATRDGAHLMLLVLTPRHWNDLIRLLDLETVVAELELSLGADFSEGGDRFRHRGVLTGLIAPWFAARTADEAEAMLKESSVLWSRYRSFRDLTREDGPLATNPLMNQVDQPGIGRYRAPGPPLQVDGIQIPATHAPTLGEHTDAVLADVLGLDPRSVTALRDRGVVA